jgi:hypothetical protein
METAKRKVHFASLKLYWKVVLIYFCVSIAEVFNVPSFRATCGDQQLRLYPQRNFLI